MTRPTTRAVNAENGAKLTAAAALQSVLICLERGEPGKALIVARAAMRRQPGRQPFGNTSEVH